MAEQRKLHVAIASFSYGGNGGIRSQVPDVGDWKLNTIMAATKDPRVASVAHFDLADTPITMTRNRAVMNARENGVDVLIMVDSDMSPDCEPDGKPFWDTAFTFLYDHYEKGPVVIGAPYGGPPPNECPYIFKWRVKRNDSPNPDYKLAMYEREEAAEMTGIGPVAALPTGLIMYDMRIFKLTEPTTEDHDPWFYYEWTDRYHSNKASTEDVTQTRDLSLTGQEVLGYNPVFCAWDCWAGHWKPHLVRKPRIVGADHVSKKFAAAVQRGTNSDEQRQYISIQHGIVPRAVPA
jgi:hypothetical protein